MTGKLVTGAAALSLCLGSAMPAMGQEHRFSGLDGPAGANATVNFRVPLGHQAERASPSVGLTVGYGRRVADGTSELRPAVRRLRVADLRFDREGLSRAELATFDLARLDQDRRLNLSDEKSWTIWLILAAFAGLAVVYAIADDESSEEPEVELPVPRPE